MNKTYLVVLCLIISLCWLVHIKNEKIISLEKKLTEAQQQKASSDAVIKSLSVQKANADAITETTIAALKIQQQKQSSVFKNIQSSPSPSSCKDSILFLKNGASNVSFE